MIKSAKIRKNRTQQLHNADLGLSMWPLIQINMCVPILEEERLCKYLTKIHNQQTITYHRVQTLLYSQNPCGIAA